MSEFEVASFFEVEGIIAKQYLFEEPGTLSSNYGVDNGKNLFILCNTCNDLQSENFDRN
jgi:hypothetical protein